MKPVSLYLHIPFCVRRCGYCNFYSTTALEQREAYIAALTRAILTAPLDDREAVTVYFGGGTPSLLGTGLLTLLEAIRTRLPLASDAEVTLEANPATLDEDTLRQLRQGGFNRISFGLQADDDESLRRLGRAHSAAQGREAVAMARRAGFPNVSIDLMLGTPGQDGAAVERLCQRAILLHPEHISAYLLTIEPETPFGREQVQRFCADSDEAAELYLTACGLLEGAGYQHYEISNFCLPGYRSRHNTVYWQLGDYLGIGPSAHSLLDGQRFYFPDDLSGFLQAENPWEHRVADGSGGDVEEYIMLALRLEEGLSFAVLEQEYGADTRRMRQHAARLAEQGLAVVSESGISLTDTGFLLSNSVINDLSDGIC